MQFLTELQDISLPSLRERKQQTSNPNQLCKSTLSSSTNCTYIEMVDVVVNRARVGLRMLDSADIWVFNSIFEGCSGEGIGVYNASTRKGNFYDIEVNNFGKVLIDEAILV
jgi:hypothetical protein